MTPAPVESRGLVRTSFIRQRLIKLFHLITALITRHGITTPEVTSSVFRDKVVRRRVTVPLTSENCAF